MTTRDEWRWTDERGVQRLVRTEELRSALANKVLPLSTLVWRPGMPEWVPAATMPELVGNIAKGAAAGAAASKPVDELSSVTNVRASVELGPYRPAAGVAATAAASGKGDPKGANAGGGGGGGAAANTAKGPVRTLMGLTSPNAGSQPARPNGPSRPIVVPAAGGSGEGTRRTVITQPPAFSGSIPPEAMPEIPRAAKVPMPITERGPVGVRPSATAAAAAAASKPTESLEAEDEEESTFVADGKGAANHPVLPPDRDGPRPSFVPPPPARGGATGPVRAAAAEPAQSAAAPAARPATGPVDDGRAGFPALIPRRDVGRAGAPSAAPRTAQEAARSPSGPPKAAAEAPHSRGPEAAAASPSPPAVATSRSPGAPASKAASPERTGLTVPLAKVQAAPGAQPAAPPAGAGAPGSAGVSPGAAVTTAVGLGAGDVGGARAATAGPAPAQGFVPVPPAAAAAPARSGPSSVAPGTARSSWAPPAAPAQAPAPPAQAPAARPQAAAAPAQRAPDPAAPPTAPVAKVIETQPFPPKPDATAAAPPDPGESPKGESPGEEPQRFTLTKPFPAPSNPGLSGPPEGAHEAPFTPPHGTAATSREALPFSAPPPRADRPSTEPAVPGARAPTTSQPERLSHPSAAPSSRRSAPAARPSDTQTGSRPRDRSSTPNGAWEEDMAAAGLPGHPLSSPVQVPVSSIFGMGGAIVVMTVAAFFVGRCSASGSPKAGEPEAARPALEILPLLSRAMMPAPLKPCWVSRQPVMWANRAAKSVPFDVFSPKTGMFALGYAADENTAFGLEINAASGEVIERFSAESRDALERVTPSPGEPGFTIITEAQGGSMQPLVRVPDAKPFFVGVGGSSVALATNVGAGPVEAPTTLWPAKGDGESNAVRVQIAGDQGYAVIFRRGSSIWGGFLDRDRKPVSELTQVGGSGGAVGKPSTGWNGKQLAVLFADRPKGADRYEMRVGLSPAGSIPSTTTVIPLPKGGPGGDAFAPDIAGLDDGRWVLVWTEGSSGSRAIRAQTLGPDLSPLGDPIALSPPAGDFGQGVLGVTEGYMTVVFLSRGKSSFELWGAMLQCG